MSHYGNFNRHSSDILPTSRGGGNFNRQPLSPISAQQQAIMEAKRSVSLNSYAKPPPSYAGILPIASDPDAIRRADDRLFDHFDDSRSISSASSFFRTAPASIATPSFVENAQLDSSVCEWIDQNRQHFPQRSFGRVGSRSTGASLRPTFSGVSGPSIYSSSVNGRDGGGSILGSNFAPTESGFFSQSRPESISGSTIGASSQLRQRRGQLSVANDDDASSVYTTASYAPSTAPSHISAMTTFPNNDTTENVEDVEMMDLDASMSSKNQTNASVVSSCISDSDVSSDDECIGSVHTKASSVLPSKPFSREPIDPFVRKDSGVVVRLLSFLLRVTRLGVAMAFRLVAYVLCLLLFLFTAFLLLYTCVYLWTHHRNSLFRMGEDSDGKTAVDVKGVRAAVDTELFGQPVAGKRILDALESLVVTLDDRRSRLLTLHGSTGVGKSHVVNVLKRYLPAGTVHILYPDLVVHDLESLDGDASVARSGLFRDWLSARLIKGKDAPFKMIVIENADAHPELVEEMAIAVKDAVDIHDAELLKALDLRSANGLTDTLDEWIDWIFGVPQTLGAQELLKSRKILFVVVSNVGFRHINALTYKITREIVEKETESESDDESVDGRVGAAVDDIVTKHLSEKEGLFFASLLKTEMEPEVVAFLPLKRNAVRRCLLANKEFVDAAAGSSVDELIRKVIIKADFFPRNDPTFSVSGCKRISSLLLS